VKEKKEVRERRWVLFDWIDREEQQKTKTKERFLLN
jgi:hypothetical protein